MREGEEAVNSLKMIFNPVPDATYVQNSQSSVLQKLVD